MLELSDLCLSNVPFWDNQTYFHFNGLCKATNAIDVSF